MVDDVLSKNSIFKRQAAGNRRDTPNIILFITNGILPIQHWKNQTISRGNHAKKTGDVTMFTVSLSGNVDSDVIQALSTDQNHRFTLNDFGDLKGMASVVGPKLCHAASTPIPASGLSP